MHLTSRLLPPAPRVLTRAALIAGLALLPATAQANELDQDQNGGAAQQGSADEPAKPAATAATSNAPTAEQMKLLGLAGRLSQSVFAGDWVTVGFGAGLVPSYEGSDNTVFFPAPVVTGSVDGYSFSTRGPGLFVDVVKDAQFAKTETILGPLIRARLDRRFRIRDAVVSQLGKRDIAVELGGSGGVRINRIFGPLDSVTIQTDVAFDVAGAHSGALVSPSIGYSTPIGTKGLINLSVSADWVDDNYADYYYSITPAGSAASGLATFAASGGIKSVGASVFTGFDLSGNALDGGWGAFALLGYTRLREDAAASPITSVRGDANQIVAGAGISYTF